VKEYVMVALCGVEFNMAAMKEGAVVVVVLSVEDWSHNFFCFF